MTREVIESAQGNVARLIQRDGKPITAAEDAAERERLNDILSSPEAFLKHQQNEGSSRTYSLQMIKLMPSAMTFSYVPGQPQPAGARSPQVVIDWKSDVLPTPETVDHYRAQVRAYLDMTGAARGLIVLVTTGEIIAVTPSPLAAVAA